MNHIDQIFEFLALREGPHAMDQISKAIGIPSDACNKIVHFLAKYDFVHINDAKVKINPKISHFVVATCPRTVLQTAS